MQAKPCMVCDSYPVRNYNIVVGFNADGPVVRILFLCDDCVRNCTVALLKAD